MLNLTKIFNAGVGVDTYGSLLTPTEEQRKYLLRCKNDIRDHLEPRIEAATVASLGMEKSVKPRFRTQGSWAYDTCVQPAHLPPQEIDWDYGVYLPVRVWEENGPPHKMAQAYFVLVERLLQDLCRAKGWSMNSGKDTCIRIQVAHWAHLDIPLYAAPESEFNKIVDRLALVAKADSAAPRAAAMTADAQYVEMAEQLWDEMTQIYMATRKGEWKPSDPEAVTRWFRYRILEHKEQLRRVCRYLKGWRDYHWRDGGGPSSISIMIAVAQAFKAQPGRDDLALENAASHLSQAILGELRERAIDEGEEDFNSRLSDADRAQASQKAHALAQTVRQARSYGQNLKLQAIADLRLQLGVRIPDQPELIEADSGADAIRSTPAQRVSRPVVGATQAG